MDIEIEDGRKLIATLEQKGFPVVAACWVKTVEDPQWFLYLASPVVDARGELRGYGQEHKLDYTAKTERVPQPQSEYLVVRDEWRRELEDYGWADQQAGTVRVPVDKAIQLYLQRQRAKQQAQESQK